MKKKRLSLNIKIALVFILFSFVLSVLCCSIIWINSLNLISSDYNQKLNNTAKIASTFIQQHDIDNYTTNGKNDEYYSTYSILKSIKDTLNATYLYVYCPYQGSDSIEIIFDIKSDNNDLESLYDLGDIVSINEMTENRKINNIFKLKVFDYQDMALFSNVLPMLDENGNTFAYIGISISAFVIFSQIINDIGVVLLIILIIIILIVGFSFVVTLLLNKSFFNNIIKISNKMGSINDETDMLTVEKLDIKANNEIQIIVDSFNNMLDDIKRYIVKIQKSTEKKERDLAKIKLARQIQSSIIPTAFPAFPDQKKFDIYADIIPAEETSGDFYDFFYTDESHIAMIIADVCTKGFPAALLMTIAQTIIKSEAQNGISPKEVFERTNNKMFESNETDMFLTAFIGIFDLNTGELRYCNAGHNPPLLKRKGETFKRISQTPNMVLAAFKNVKYKEYSTTLKKGDCLLMYTDGVTEAKNANDELYTEKRLLESINSIEEKDLSPINIVQQVKNSVFEFVGTAQQFDDITIMAFEVTDDIK